MGSEGKIARGGREQLEVGRMGWRGEGVSEMGRGRWEMKQQREGMDQFKMKIMVGGEGSRYKMAI